MGNGSPSVDRNAPETVERLWRQYNGILVRYFKRRGIDGSDAQDLAQAVFERLSKQDALANVERTDAYLFAAAANALTEFYRRRSVRTKHPPESFYEALQRTEEFTPERILAERQELNLVLATLKEMPERMRHIFVLARLESMPRAEIAQRLGVSKRLVEQQITLATAWLAERRKKLT